MTASLSSVEPMKSDPPPLLHLPPIDYDEEEIVVDDEETTTNKRDNCILNQYDHTQPLDNGSLVVPSITTTTTATTTTNSQDDHETNKQIIVVANSIQQIFKNEMKFMQNSNGSSKTLGKSKVMSNGNESNLNSTSISNSGGSGRFHAIRNWLKQNRWRKKSGKQTPPPPNLPPPPPSSSSTQNTPTTTQTTNNSSLFSSLFESHNTETSVRSASTLLGKKGAKLKLKENNLTISSSGGGGIKIKESKSKKSNNDKKLNNTITNTDTYTSHYDVEVSAITPHKNHFKQSDISTPVSFIVQQSKNENDTDSLDKNKEFDINREFSYEVNSLSSKCNFFFYLQYFYRIYPISVTASYRTVPLKIPMLLKVYINRLIKF